MVGTEDEDTQAHIADLEEQVKNLESLLGDAPKKAFARIAELEKQVTALDCGASVASCAPYCLKHARSEAERFHNEAREAQAEWDEERVKVIKLREYANHILTETRLERL